MVLDSGEARHIWNRAIRVSLLSSKERSDLSLRPGDEARAAVLELDSPAGNGGLLHGIEVVGDEKVRMETSPQDFAEVTRSWDL